MSVNRFEEGHQVKEAGRMSKRTFGWSSLGVALLFTVLMDAGAQEARCRRR